MKVVISGTISPVQSFPILLQSQLAEIGISSTLVRHDFKRIGEKIKKVWQSDVIHVVSIKPCGIEGIFWVLCFTFMRLTRRRIIIHWIGTDVLTLSPLFAKCFSRLGNMHLSQAPWLVEELKAKGVVSRWLPIVPSLVAVCEPLPRMLTVLTYLGSRESKNDFYGKEDTEELIKRFPDVNFLIVGKVGRESKLNLSNVSYLGLVESERMNDVYNSSTVLLRLTKHDGLSFMVLEALNRGRYVIWTKDFPYCYMAKDSSEAIEYFEALRGVNIVNEHGIKFINDSFDNKWVGRLVNEYRRVCECL